MWPQFLRNCGHMLSQLRATSLPRSCGQRQAFNSLVCIWLQLPSAFELQRNFPWPAPGSNQLASSTVASRPSPSGQLQSYKCTFCRSRSISRHLHLRKNLFRGFSSESWQHEIFGPRCNKFCWRAANHYKGVKTPTWCATCLCCLSISLGVCPSCEIWPLSHQWAKSWVCFLQQKHVCLTLLHLCQ